MARRSAAQPQRRWRVRDVVMLVPALAFGVLLLAVFVADRTGVPVTDLLQPSGVGELVPAAFTSEP